MKISIAMCTYNGARFLPGQLDSIANQSRPPDELVICDDGSVDETITILSAFCSDCFFPTSVYRNEINIGSTKNFEKAISLCKGEIIALSDQDDVWLPDKLRQIETVFKNYPDVGYVFSDAEVVNERIEPVGYSLWVSNNFTKKLQHRFVRGKAFDTLLRSNVVTGATMAFRSSLRRFILPIPSSWRHDAWIAFVLSVVSKAFIFPRLLIKYRQHSQQQIGTSRETLRKKVYRAFLKDRGFYEAEVARWSIALKHLSNPLLFNDINSRVMTALRNKIQHMKNRATISCNGFFGMRTIFLELLSGRYHRYSHGWKSVVEDITRLMKLCINK